MRITETLLIFINLWLVSMTTIVVAKDFKKPVQNYEDVCSMALITQ